MTFLIHLDVTRSSVYQLMRWLATVCFSLTGLPMQVARSLFVEPSTNDAFPVDAAPYINIEYLWNQYNFWVALPKPCDQEGMAQPKAFDLDDGVQWQRLLDHPACQVRAQALPAHKP